MKLNCWSIIIASVLILSATFSSCKLEEKEGCAKTEYPGGKVVNLETTVHIKEFATNDPVVGEQFSLQVDHITCEGDTALLYYNDQDTTDAEGLYVSDVLNFVMYNSADKIEVTAIAPNLVFHNQNYMKQTIKFGEFKGTGKDEVLLQINKALQP